MTVRPVPEGYASLTPGMNLKGAAKAIEFFTKVFGAELVEKYEGPNGQLVHVDMKIAAGHIMFAESVKDPVQNMHASIYVPDCDAVFKRAVDNGATVKRPLEDMFYGDRMGTVTDPFGNVWTIGTHKEDVSKDEMKRRMESMMKPA
jgi:PhnB protein